MNKLLRILGLVIIFIFNSCECDDCKGNGIYKTKVTVKFINETSENILSLDGCNRNIEPGNTKTFIIEETLGQKPNIDNFPVSIFTNCIMKYQAGSDLKCEEGIN